MSSFVIDGGTRLKGEITPHGAKNSVLPILAASVLCESEVVLHNCPDLTDVHEALKILSFLGSKASFSDHTVCINSSNAEGTEIPDELMRKMRSSVVFLGAVSARNGKIKLTYPGGCELGARPIDLHLKAFRAMGLHIEDCCGELLCECKNGLKGTDLTLDFPSVGATENIMIAASKAKGRTTIVNAAREPEIVDLANFLRKCGAKIYGDGESIIEIDGVDKLYGCEYTVMPDRIEAATFLAAAAQGGELVLKGVNLELIYPIVSVLRESGCEFDISDDSVHMYGPKKLRRISCIRTMPHPGFPTDAQAIIMALSSVASGTSIFIENIFENRFRHVPELIRMGAKIKTEGRAAIVEGVDHLYGCPLIASDLRGGAALVIAAMIADGRSEISNICYIDRGYEKLENTLSRLGAKIRRM